MEEDSKDQLWVLLGRSRAIEASPRFTEGVMAAVEKAGQDRPRPAWQIPLLWWATAGAAAAIVAGIFLWSDESAQSTTVLALASTNSPVTVAPGIRHIKNNPVESYIAGQPRALNPNLFVSNTASKPAAAAPVHPLDEHYQDKTVHQLDLIPVSYGPDASAE